MFCVHMVRIQKPFAPSQLTQPTSTDTILNDLIIRMIVMDRLLFMCRDCREREREKYIRWLVGCRDVFAVDHR